jgi:hypothetical protein
MRQRLKIILLLSVLFPVILFVRLMTQPLNKAVTCAFIVCGLVLAWHLIWVVCFGSLEGIWQTGSNMYDSVRDDGKQVRGWVPFYFVLFPVAILAVAIAFIWHGRVFFKQHPFRFWAVIIAALSPIALASYFWFTLTHVFM